MWPSELLAALEILSVGHDQICERYRPSLHWTTSFVVASIEKIMMVAHYQILMIRPAAGFLGGPAHESDGPNSLGRSDRDTRDFSRSRSDRRNSVSILRDRHESRGDFGENQGPIMRVTKSLALSLL